MVFSLSFEKKLYYNPLNNLNSLKRMTMQDHIFRMYDIRGKVGSELLINQVRQCAHAIAFYYKQLDSTVQTLGVAMDGRTHSPAIKKELVAGLQESGINVFFLSLSNTSCLFCSVPLCNRWCFNDHCIS